MRITNAAGLAVSHSCSLVQYCNRAMPRVVTPPRRPPPPPVLPQRPQVLGVNRGQRIHKAAVLAPKVGDVQPLGAAARAACAGPGAGQGAPDVHLVADGVVRKGVEW